MLERRCVARRLARPCSYTRYTLPAGSNSLYQAQANCPTDAQICHIIIKLAMSITLNWRHPNIIIITIDKSRQQRMQRAPGIRKTVDKRQPYYVTILHTHTYNIIRQTYFWQWNGSVQFHISLGNPLNVKYRFHILSTFGNKCPCLLPPRLSLFLCLSARSRTHFSTIEVTELQL